MNTRHGDDYPMGGILRPELLFGAVSLVSIRTVGVNLFEAGRPTGSHFSGARYGRGEVGEFVLIEGQQHLVLGRIVEIRLREQDRSIITRDFSGSENLEALGTVLLLGTVRTHDLKVTAGVVAYPRLGDRVYAASHDFIARIPELMEKDGSVPSTVNLDLGTIGASRQAAVSLNPEILFGRHCAILGATGSGKSWTIARIIEECLRHRSKMLLIDATGEYASLDDSSIAHCHLGTPVVEARVSKKVRLSPECFNETDFIALFEPAGKVQGPKLREAIRSLRLAQLRPDLATDGVIKKIGQSKAKYEEAIKDPDVACKLDDPAQPFDYEKLPAQLEQECAYPSERTGGLNDPSKWGSLDEGTFGYCYPLIIRIHAVLSSQALKCVFDASEDVPRLTDRIDEFLSNDQSKMLRICLSGVSYEYKAREIVANAVGRYLLDKARGGYFKNRPLVIIVDEAHNFLGRHIGSEETIAKLDAFELIAREGRKYGLNICLASQRPRDVTEGILSQMGVLIVHRITNDRDREVVERACGEIDQSVSGLLPNLLPGQAVIIGTGFPIPLTIQIQEPAAKPKFAGPSYLKNWARQHVLGAGGS